VGGEAVALDDEPLLGPGGVELALVARAVDRRRSRQTVCIEEREKAALEDARRDGLAVLVVVVEDACDGSRPSPSGVPREQGIERGRAREAADLRLVERCLQVLR
jgi:hypothetical protein